MKTKALISFEVTAKLICVFVFAYAKSQFTHNEAHLMMFIGGIQKERIKFYIEREEVLLLLFLYCCPQSATVISGWSELSLITKLFLGRFNQRG